MTLHSIWDGENIINYMRYIGVGVRGCRPYHMGLPWGCTPPWHLEDISYRRVIVRWVFAEHIIWDEPLHGLTISSTLAIKDTSEIHQLRCTLPWYLGRGNNIINIWKKTFWGWCCFANTIWDLLQHDIWDGAITSSISAMEETSRGGGCGHHHLAPGYGRSSRAFQTDWPWRHVGHGEAVIVGDWRAHPNVSAVVDTVNLKTQLAGLVQSSTTSEEHLRDKTHALDTFGYAWYDPYGVGQVLHISKWTLAGDVRNPHTRRTQEFPLIRLLQSKSTVVWS